MRGKKILGILFSCTKCDYAELEKINGAFTTKRFCPYDSYEMYTQVIWGHSKIYTEVVDNER
jgi:hypothetical protein